MLTLFPELSARHASKEHAAIDGTSGRNTWQFQGTTIVSASSRRGSRTSPGRVEAARIPVENPVRLHDGEAPKPRGVGCRRDERELPGIAHPLWQRLAHDALYPRVVLVGRTEGHVDEHAILHNLPTDAWFGWMGKLGR